MIFMLPELNEIKNKRKELGLTQTELSEKTGVPQSLIAKIEAGKISPSYEKAKKLFDFLFFRKEEKEITAKDLMSRKLFFVSGNSTLIEAIELMEKKAVSQLPVIDSGKCIGSINEKNTLNALNESNNKEKLLETKISKIMGKAFPLLKENALLERINEALKENEAILIINENNKVTGIITKTDLLKKMAGKK
ncbi:MAG: CBS domain-containing protein [Candidatus Diapherotrites archaeon]|nr:CBS domain-containing protein [Candidatus Diapherotrites archaeon]